MQISMPRCLTAVGLASCVTGAMGAVFSVPCSTGTCFQQYQCRLDRCNDIFNNDHPDNDDYLNSEAWAQCREGASLHRAACRNGVGKPHLEVYWQEFINHLKSCIDEFVAGGQSPNPVNLTDCVEEALQHYREQLDDVTPPAQDACEGQAVPRDAYGNMFLGKMETLRSAAIVQGNADGKFPVAVNSTASVSAGDGIRQGVAYDASQMACVKSAMAIAIYRTKTGTVVLPMDADLDTSDGTHFDIMFFGSSLVDTDEVMLVTVFFDENDKPVFGEYGWFEIEQSPLTGDWNRDGVVNADDLIDFLESHSAGMPRADLNGDEALTSDDTWIFLQGYID